MALWRKPSPYPDRRDEPEQRRRPPAGPPQGPVRLGCTKGDDDGREVMSDVTGPAHMASRATADTEHRWRSRSTGAPTRRRTGLERVGCAARLGARALRSGHELGKRLAERLSAPPATWSPCRFA